MKFFSIILILSTLFITHNIQAQDLQSHEWKDRLFIILTSDSSVEEYKKQLEILRQNKPGLEERKLIIYSVFPDKYQQGIDSAKWFTSSEFYNQFSKKNQKFEVILIGLDGGIKLRQNDILPIEKLFSRIDAMPMRRSEMRNKKKTFNNESLLIA